MGGVVKAAGSAAGAVAKPRRRPAVRASAEVRRAILGRLAMGEALAAVCAEAGMPTHGTVGTWAKGSPQFAAALRRARAAAGWRHPTSPGSRYCPVAAAEIYGRLCEGEPLYRICEDPEMPAHSTVYRWRLSEPEFAEALAVAREVVAERYADMGWEIARAVTPGDAYATHVKLVQLRWNAGAMSPGRFGRFRPVEAAVVAEAAAEAPREVVFHVRHFERVIGEDGRAYVREAPPLPEGMAAEKG